MVNRNRLLWAGFMAILAAGVGFAIRGSILGDWKAEFGFTDSEVGGIGGYGLLGFCFGILIGGVIADKIGYGWLVIAAFVLHVLSAVVTFAAKAAPLGSPEAVVLAAKGAAYNYLSSGSFIFVFANGMLEAVANPLVATLFPEKRTHYLNILHASWPAGLVLGGIAGWTLGAKGDHWWQNADWRYQLALYLVPTLIYGLMFLGQKMPKSEASEKGLNLGEMFKDVGILGGLVACYLLAIFFGREIGRLIGNAETGSYIGYGIGGALLIAVGVITRFSTGSILLFFLFIAHALIGAVELGTDGWIQNITGNILTKGEGNMLFVWASLVMFSLRFCANFIEKRIGLSPVGILTIGAILACIGLNLTSLVTSFVLAMLAVTVYAVGKTFFWPTMLAVASDRFPRTGAIAISFMGGIGMMSAGLLGFPGLGYAKDRFASEELERVNPDAYVLVKAKEGKAFLFFREVAGFDGTKEDAVKERLRKAREDASKTGQTDTTAAINTLTPADRAIVESSITGDRKTLVVDSLIPALMALIYLGILLYFKAIGGYKAVHIGAAAAGGPATTPNS